MSRYKRIGETSLQTAVGFIAGRLAAIENCRKSNNTEWLDKHTDTLEAFMKQTAPSGSGFDAGTTIDLDKSTPEKLVFNTSFHHMDEAGGYDGWTDHTVTVGASLLFEFTIRISGKDRNDIKDYIHEEFDMWLSTYFAHTIDGEGLELFMSEYWVNKQLTQGQEITAYLSK